MSFEKGQKVWVRFQERDAWGWEGVVFYEYPFVRYLAGKDFAVIDREVPGLPQTQTIVAVDRILDHRPEAEEDVWELK